MDMMLNSLPSRTWNRLGINESFVAIEETFENHIPETDWNGETARWTPNAGETAGWENLKTGMGEDICKLTEAAPAALVKTEAGVKMDAPVVLNYRYQNHETGISRLRLHAAADSVLSVVMLLASEEDARGISAIQTEIRADAGAKVRLYVAQILGKEFACFNDIGGICEENASVELVKLELGAGKLYAGTHVDLKGRESEFTANVGYHVRENQKMDMNYVALHHGERTNSLMEVSGTLEEGARKVFRGTIDFPRGCAGAKGTENENVLLLSDHVINQTIPLILCKEEDVEGNHGASIGKLDDKVLFYMSARGIPEAEAQQIIAQARIDSLCEKIPDEGVREIVHNFKI